MLTENYLLCFKKGNKSDFLSKMGKFQFKLNLIDDIRTINLNQTTTHGKSYCIDVNEGAMFLFDKDLNLLKEWYESLMKTRQRCEMIRQEQEIKFRKEKQNQQRKEIRKEILSERIERRKLIVSNNVDNKRESLLDKFSEKYQIDKLHNSSSKLSSDKSTNSKRTDDDYAFEYLNNLRQRLTGVTSASSTELNRSISNLAQIKTNTPIISNRKRMSLQRKSLLSQFDSFLGSPLSHSSSKSQIHQPQDNIVNLANLVNLTAAATGNKNWDNQKLIVESMESPTMLPRIAPQCGGQLNKSTNKQLTNSCSVFQFGNNSNNLNNSPAFNQRSRISQRSLYAERILSNSSLTLSNLSKFPNSRHSTLSSGTSFSQFISKPFRDSIHYATSLRKDNVDNKSHLKSATSEFSFIRLTNNSSSNTSSLTKKQTDDDTLKRNRNARSNSNRNAFDSFSNDCSGDYLDSEQDLSISTATDFGTLRNELKESKTITNINSELSNRALILNPSDLGIGLTDNNLINNQMNDHHHHQNHNYQKLKKINNSLDESDSTFSSSNSSSSSSSNNYHPIINHQRQSTRIDQMNNLKNNCEILSYSSNLIQSPLINERNKRNTSTKKDLFDDHTYQKVNSNKNNKQSINSNKTTSSMKSSNLTKSTNGTRSQSKRKPSSIPISSLRNFNNLNEPIYQSTEKRKNRMNKILENQSKIYVSINDLK